MALALLMLRKIQPQTYRPFRIPDRWVKFVAYLALISCLMVTAISFIPGAGGQGGAIADLFYHTIALVILSLPPFFFKEKK